MFATRVASLRIESVLLCSFNPLSRLMCLQLEVLAYEYVPGFGRFQSPFEADVFATCYLQRLVNVAGIVRFNPLSRLMCLQLGPLAGATFDGMTEFQSPFEADVFATYQAAVVQELARTSFNPLSRLMCLQPSSPGAASRWRRPSSFNPLSRLMCLQLWHSRPASLSI